MMWVIIDKTTKKYWGPFRSGLDVREFISRSWPDVPQHLWTKDQHELIEVVSLNNPEWK